MNSGETLSVRSYNGHWLLRHSAAHSRESR
jgi:hypothetical protein